MRQSLIAAIFSVISVIGYSQTQTIDSLKEVIDNQQGRLNALDERVMINEADLGKHNKIKFSGYIQAQWETFQKDVVSANGPDNTFLIRRARFKITYEAVDGVKFVLQPDFSTGNIALKDAYAVLNLPKLKNLSLWAGQFNRINYEVEYSSSQREIMERSRVIRTLYPGEREIGAKLEYAGIKFPLKAQLMVLNGNFSGKEPIDADTKKDVMGRLVYSLKFRDAGIGIDFGTHGYYGGNQTKNNEYVSFDPSSLDSLELGSYLDKRWLGGEIQLFADVLGGLAVKGEYIRGTNSTVSTLGSTASTDDFKKDPNKVRNFAGYYLYFIKNIGAKNQIVARYDFYDPNTDLEGDAALKELSYKTWAFAWQYYLNDFIRISVQYTIPVNETNSTTSEDKKDNVFGIRVQAKF